MNTRSRQMPQPYHPSEAEIRAKALEVYIRSGWLPGRDMENWLEAESELMANPPHEAPAEHAPAEHDVRSHSRHVVHKHA